jgi:sulfopyruvate decarboxylase subunit alpha
MIDKKIVDSILGAGTDIIMSLPCNMLAGILREITRRDIVHIPVCREEEGVGIAAGAALAGRKPLLLMQNSGLGNAINALLSLTGLYRLPLFMLISHRGAAGEQIAAQIPMGAATPELLRAVSVQHMKIADPAGIESLGAAIRKTYRENTMQAALLSRELWQ